MNALRVAVAAALYAATLTSWLVAVWSPYHWQSIRVAQALGYAVSDVEQQLLGEPS